MDQKPSRYHYHSPHQMHPLLPSQKKMDELRPLAAELIGRAKDLSAQGMPHLRTLLREALRPMNSFYTNKIEGQHTEPLLIEKALQQDFSSKPDEARKQRIAVAHIDTERWGETAYPSFHSDVFFTSTVVQAVHKHLHDQLPENELIQVNDEGVEEKIVPGEWRHDGVQVGRHIPPAPEAVPKFMDEWHRGYMFSRAGETAVIALTRIATSATPDDERYYGVEDGGKRSRNILAVGPRI